MKTLFSNPIQCTLICFTVFVLKVCLKLKGEYGTNKDVIVIEFIPLWIQDPMQSELKALLTKRINLQSKGRPIFNVIPYGRDRER